MMNFDWAQRVEASRFQLTKREAEILAYLEAHFDALHQLAISDIVAATNTSRSTVHRFCVKMGYEGLKEFKQAMNRYNRAIKFPAPQTPPLELTPKTASDAAISNAASAFDLFQQGFAVDLQALHQAAAMYSEPQIARIVARLAKANTLYCVGYQTGAFMAQFLGERFSRLKKRVQIATGEKRRIKDLVFPMEAGDLLWLFEYHKQFDFHLHLVEFAQQRGAATLLMTDYPTSPLIVRVDDALLAHRGLPNFKNSLAVPMTVVNGLQLAYEFEMGDKRAAALQEWDEFAFSNFSKEILDAPPPA